MKVWRTCYWVLAWALIAFHLASFVGCSTVRPKPLTEAQPSWDGNEQNSGFLGFAPGGGGLITENARARYNELIEVYGKHYSPPLKPDAGVKEAWKTEAGRQVWSIDAQHLVRFGEMNRWRKAGRK